jgi:putative Mn2+ efflux pump MntP
VSTAPRLRKLAVTSLIFYAVDMAMAFCGFVYGFGLHLESLAAVVGFMVLSR